MRLSIAGFAFTLLALALCPAAAQTNELGHPVVRQFPPGHSHLNHLCQAVAQDGDGFIYAANFTEAAVYDGTAWRQVPVPDECAGIREFGVSGGGVVFAGGAGVIGYFRPDGVDRRFVSLADRLPPTAGESGNIYHVLAVGDTVYFSDEDEILIWRDGQFTVVPCHSPPHSHGARLHRVGESVYVTVPGGPLCRLSADRLEVVVDAPFFRDNQIVTLEAGGAGSLDILTQRHGLYRWAGGHAELMSVEANRWLAGKVVLRAQRLGDGSLAVAFAPTSGNGGMRFGSDGSYLGQIDQTIGLYVRTLRGFFCDREGGLWCGTETGLFRIEWPSAVTVFDGINGLGQGAVADVIRHRGVLYAATTEGAYRLVPGDERDGGCAHFERIIKLPSSSFVSFPDGSLWAVTSSRGLIHLDGPSARGALPRAEDRAGPLRADPPAPGWNIEGGDITYRAVPGAPPRRLPRLALSAIGPATRLVEEPGAKGSVLWICGAAGLVRLEEMKAFPQTVSLPLMLDSRDVRQGESLTPSASSVRFSFVALRHQIADAVTYQCRLSGLDDTWSAWSPGRERVYGHLQPGHYRFEVQARDADEITSAPAALAFDIMAPWWRAPWAMVGWFAAGSGLLAGAARFGNRRLRKRAGHLEALVAQRTGELAHKNEELTRLHRLESEEKIAARLAEEKARLEVLRYQLNPHFLYNTLASISSALPAVGSPARAMLDRLAEFCRLTLNREDDSEGTTLAQEIRLLRTYLEIEQSRWGELLEVTMSVAPGLEREPLPYFLLLPLVENALKFGRATSPDKVRLRVAASCAADGELVLEVSNTGEWVEPGQKKTASSLGIGLDNLRQRLARHYPGAHRLEFTHGEGWVTVVLRINRPPVA